MNAQMVGLVLEKVALVGLHSKEHTFGVLSRKPRKGMRTVSCKKQGNEDRTNTAGACLGWPSFRLRVHKKTNPQLTRPERANVP